MDAARFQPSAFSTQLLNKYPEHALFFFIKCKEDTYKDSIRREGGWIGVNLVEHLPDRPQ
jgi:hypothetical protein